MHRYDIYLLKPGIARQFIQLENKLFQLFKEYETVPSLHHEVQKQVDYICQPISIHHLGEWLSSAQITPFPQGRDDGLVYYLEESESVKLMLSERRVQIWSTLHMEDEWPWFDQLQAYDPYFFACDVERGRYGWLKPIKMHTHLFG
ncbi:sporulation inhibitor of replication protein SirA [Salicibibacter cibarius]|uniref:Sporulation inhibitor of replication protein SirA n=1 Tax=Salicibibacter cibarius TaxID=2743000 RepID=A0A7T7CBQ4_9BACI|nr:sporulation inhibitor of replication protein SirA [Salicibibacter cibarius]QQK76229.1 sporulation inhibitor of replication protein SirA [Salicibibacter cibarius]